MNAFEQLRIRSSGAGAVIASASSELRTALEWIVRGLAIAEGVELTPELLSEGVDALMEKYFSPSSNGLVAHGSHDQSSHGNWAHPGEFEEMGDEPDSGSKSSGLRGVFGRAKKATAEKLEAAKDALVEEVTEATDAVRRNEGKIKAVASVVGTVAAGMGLMAAKDAAEHRRSLEAYGNMTPDQKSRYLRGGADRMDNEMRHLTALEYEETNGNGYKKALKINDLKPRNTANVAKIQKRIKTLGYE